MSEARLAGIVSAALLLAPLPAQAAMTYVPDTGTVARSRGGAYAAAAEDGIAIVYNPAGFADQKGKRVYFDVTVLQLNSSFQRADDANGSYKKVTNSGAPKISPTLVYSMPFGEKLNWHIGLAGAVGVNMKYPKAGPQRYTTQELVPQQLTYSTGVAYRFHPMVAAGLTVGAMYITNETSVAVTGATAEPFEDRQTDIDATLSVENPMVPVGILGVKVTPIPNVEIGLSYRPPVTANLEGTYETDPVDPNGSPGSYDVTLVVPLPQIIRSGVRYVQPGWDVELDLVMEDWTTRDQDTIKGRNGDRVGIVEKVEVIREGQAAYSVRLGGSYKLGEALKLHAGLLHETSGIPTNRWSVNVYDGPKTGLGLGTTYAINEKFGVSGNLSYLQVAKTTVKDSKVQQRSPLPSQGGLHTVGNGTYDGAYMFGGISLNASF